MIAEVILHLGRWHLVVRGVYLALIFAVAFAFTLFRAVTQPSARFIADAVLYGGLTLLFVAIVRRGKL